ncbi:Organ specific protein [Parasponia andersonii]|uniref:Organ specific protein n=1 Tax=Parasponia andersonii TaxID=3476 RepID=A0A2P5DUB0_PARAD|nr:Organ specific protein [Parasponia andersonii]
MKEEPMPKAILGLIVRDSDSTPKNSNEKKNCGLGTKISSFSEDFEPTPNATAYPDDDAKSALETSPNDEIEPIRADSTAYHGNKASDQKPFAKDFEPIPHATAYNE